MKTQTTDKDKNGMIADIKLYIESGVLELLNIKQLNTITNILQ
jgi:flagellar basal body rod protein FlgF